MTLLYVAFLASGHDFDWLELVTGSAAGFLYTVGAVCIMVSIETGPGGPI